MSSKQKDLIQHLVRAARGQGLRSKSKTNNLNPQKQWPPLPCFPLQKHHFGRIKSCTTENVPTPSDFHTYLCNKIRHAQNRVVLASLYIGVGSDRTKSLRENACKEDELLHALNDAASNPRINKIQILLDANRALREVSYTSSKSAQSHSGGLGRNQTYSAKAVYKTLEPFLQHREDTCSGIFLFPVNNFQLCSILPSPLGEVAGVFHIKVSLYLSNISIWPQLTLEYSL